MMIGMSRTWSIWCVVHFLVYSCIDIFPVILDSRWLNYVVLVVFYF